MLCMHSYELMIAWSRSSSSENNSTNGSDMVAIGMGLLVGTHILNNEMFWIVGWIYQTHSNKPLCSFKLGMAKTACLVSVSWGILANYVSSISFSLHNNSVMRNSPFICLTCFAYWASNSIRWAEKCSLVVKADWSLVSLELMLKSVANIIDIA